MNNLGYLFISFSCLVLSTCSAPPSHSELAVGGSRIGLFKGVDAITEAMRATLIHPDDRLGFNFRTLIDAGTPNNPLSDLLGGFIGTEGNAKLENDSPHSISMMLWKNKLEVLTNLLAQNCEHSENPGIRGEGLDVRLHPRFASALLSFCLGLPSDPELRSDLWHAVMGWEAPASEEEAWKSFLREEETYLLSLSAADRISLVLMALFLDPYFLLET